MTSRSTRSTLRSWRLGSTTKLDPSPAAASVPPLGLRRVGGGGHVRWDLDPRVGAGHRSARIRAIDNRGASSVGDINGLDDGKA